MFKRIPPVIGFITDSWTLLLYLAFGGGAGGGAVVAYLKDLPIIYPIIFGVMGFGLISLSIFIGYKKWQRIMPLVNDELKNTTRILTEMSFRVHELMMMSRIEKINIKEIVKVRDYLSDRLQIKENPQLLNISKDERYKIILHEAHKAKLDKDVLSPKFINTMLEVVWVLEHFNIGSISKINNPEDIYQKRYLELSSRITSMKINKLIMVYKDICLGFNGIILFQQLFPIVIKEELPNEVNKTLGKWIDDRNKILDIYLQYIRENIRKELYKRGGL